MTLKNFIVFEGIDGSGTSTQIKNLVERDLNKFVATAEPTKKETGLFLRKMLGGDFSVDSKTAAYLFAADRNRYGKLVRYYEQLGFELGDNFYVNKGEYDYTCYFMCQPVTSLRTRRNEFFRDYNKPKEPEKTEEPAKV